MLDTFLCERTSITTFLTRSGYFWNYVKRGKFGIGKETCVGLIESPKRKAQHANGFGSELLVRFSWVGKVGPFGVRFKRGEMGKATSFSLYVMS